ARGLAGPAPRAARDALKPPLIGREGNPALTPEASAPLRARLTREMEAVDRVGRVVSRDIAQAAAMRAAADARTDIRRQAQLASDRIRERMRVFHNLMDQAREPEAAFQADHIRTDRV